MLIGDSVEEESEGSLLLCVFLLHSLLCFIRNKSKDQCMENIKPNLGFKIFGLIYLLLLISFWEHIWIVCFIFAFFLFYVYKQLYIFVISGFHLSFFMSFTLKFLLKKTNEK